MKRRFWAGLLSFVMLCSLLPASALATEEGAPKPVTSVTEENSPVYIHKSVNDAGNELTLEAYVTDEKSTQTTYVPMDIVLVLDVSGSMNEKIASYDYKEVYDAKKGLDHHRTYYYNDNGTYKRAYYCGWQKGWYTEEHRIFSHRGTHLTPKTSQSSTGTQFYERITSQSQVTKMKAMQDAVNNFIDSVAGQKDSDGKNVAHKISIVKFAGDKTDKVGNDTYYDFWRNKYNCTQVVKELTDVTNSADLKAAVNELREAGATRADYGMEKAADVLNGREDKSRPSIVVMFTDGEPTSTDTFEWSVAGAAVDAAKTLKNAGTKVYTIGMFNGANPTNVTDNFNKYMNGVSSNYPNAVGTKDKHGYKGIALNDRAEGNYYFKADNAGELDNVFQSISNDVSTLKLKVGTDTVLSDTLSKYFDFDGVTAADTSKITVKTANVKGVDEESGAYEWDDAKLFQGAQVKVEGKKLEVTNFDYKAKAVTKNTDGTYTGAKLIVTIPIKPDINCTDWEAGEQPYPTNNTTDSKAGLFYKDENEKEASTKLDASPEVNVTAYTVKYQWENAPAGVTLPTAERKAYITGQKFTVDGTYYNGYEKSDAENKYTFGGWNPNGEQTVEDQNIVIKGEWSTEAIKPTEYTVTYHANNGTETTYTDTFAANAQVAARGSRGDVGTFSVALTDSVSFEYPNMKFKGWAETSDEAVNGAVKYTPGAEITSAIADDYDLYAVWDTSTPAGDQYQLVYFAGPYGFLTRGTTYVASKADPKMYDKGTTAYVKYNDPEFAITLDSTSTSKNILFLGWTEDSNTVGKIYELGDEIPKLVTEVKMTGDKAVYAVYGEDANEDGKPDVYQAKVTYKVVNGWWTKNGTALSDTEIDAWFDLYQKNGNGEIVTLAPTLGDTVPAGHSGNTGYTGIGWFMDDFKDERTTVMEKGPDRTTLVTKPETLYTFVYEATTHKTDIVDILNAIVKKEFTKANNVESGDVTFTAEATITMQEPEVDINSLPEVEPAGASHTILGTVTLSTKVGTGSFVFARSLDDVNPADGNYFVEVSEVKGGADNVTYDNRTFIVNITVKDGAVDKDNVQIAYSVDGSKELVPVNDITFKNTYTKSSSGGHDDDSDTYYLAIKKIDAQDGHVLKGAKFGLYADGKQIATATSNSDGYAVFSLDESVYNKLSKNDELYYTELTAPEGYVRSSREYTVSVSDFTKNSMTSAKKNADTVKNSSSSTPDRLNDEDHFAYVIGYKDGNVRPYGLISRAETTTIFFRLLKDSVRDGNLLTSNTYTDVPDNYWANTAISTMTGLGIVQGRTATTFDPQAPITRAQFAAICARFDDGKTQGTQTFTDIQGHWAQAYIERAAELGWIKGFEDGSFRPDTYITRAQAMTMINRVLNRIPEENSDLLSSMNVWPDCNPGDWFYLAVQEATNSHDYKHKAGNYETWASMNKDPNWTRYEN